MDKCKDCFWFLGSASRQGYCSNDLSEFDGLLMNPDQGCDSWREKIDETPDDGTFRVIKDDKK